MIVIAKIQWSKFVDLERRQEQERQKMLLELANLRKNSKKPAEATPFTKHTGVPYSPADLQSSAKDLNPANLDTISEEPEKKDQKVQQDQKPHQTEKMEQIHPDRKKLIEAASLEKKWKEQQKENARGFYQKRKQKKWIQKELSPPKPKPPARYPMPQKRKRKQKQKNQNSSQYENAQNDQYSSFNIGYPNQNQSSNQWKYQTGWENWSNEQQNLQFGQQNWPAGFNTHQQKSYADISFHSRPQETQTNFFQPSYYDFQKTYAVQQYQNQSQHYLSHQSHNHQQVPMDQSESQQQRQHSGSSGENRSSRFPDASSPPNRRL